MRLVTLAEPATEPLALSEVKSHIRLDSNDEDAGLTALITAARGLVETRYDLMLIGRPVALFLDHWPIPVGTPDGCPWWSGVRDGVAADVRQFLKLAARPVSAVTSIQTLAPDGTATDWPAANYYLKPGLHPGLYRRAGVAWPVQGRVADGIKISLTAGFGPTPADVPADIRQALLMLVAYLYEHRGDSDMNAVPAASGAAALMAPYRKARL